MTLRPKLRCLVRGSLELGMAVKKAFGITFSKNPADNKQIFYSVKTLADYVEGNKS